MMSDTDPMPPTKAEAKAQAKADQAKADQAAADSANATAAALHDDMPTHPHEDMPAPVLGADPVHGADAERGVRGIDDDHHLEPPPPHAALNEVSDAEQKRRDDDAHAAEQAEADKARRAEAQTTAAANGELAGPAFWQRIQDAKFEIRNLGFTAVEQLIDELYAGVQRLEAKHHGG